MLLSYEMIYNNFPSQKMVARMEKMVDDGKLECIWLKV